MPSPATSQTSSAKGRRGRRHGRRVSPRAFTSSIATPRKSYAVRRRTARRVNRDQASLDLDNCFNICQDQGFHHDPDIRIGIGSEPVQVNHFAVLDPDASAPCSPRLDASREGVLQPRTGDEPAAPSHKYLDDIRIPSPLLYHRRSREQLLTEASDAGIRDEVKGGFGIKCGREQPAPDFESYKVVDATPGWEDADGMVKRQREGLACYNIRRAPWVAQPCQLIGQRLGMPPILTTTNTFSIGQLGIPCNDNTLPPAYDSVQGGFNLLPSDGYLKQTLKRSLVTDFVDDDPDEVRKRWQAFEDVVCNLTRKSCSSEDTVIARSSATLQPRRWPGPECMALVPLRLYSQQYVGLTPAPMMDAFPTAGQQPKSGRDSDTADGQVAEWMVSEESGAAGSKSGESSVFGLDLLFEGDDWAAAEAPPRTPPPCAPYSSSSAASAQSDSFDEGYCTGESLVNVDRAEAEASSDDEDDDDDDWERWD